jgi:hypothetical protein
MNSTPVAAKIDESKLKQVVHPTPGNKYYVVTYLKDLGRDRRGPTEYTLDSWVWGGNPKVLDSNNKPHVFYDRKVLFYEVPSAAAAADHDVGNGGKRRNNRRKSAKKGGRSRIMRRMRRSNNRKSSRRF